MENANDVQVLKTDKLADTKVPPPSVDTGSFP